MLRHFSNQIRATFQKIRETGNLLKRKISINLSFYKLKFKG